MGKVIQSIYSRIHKAFTGLPSQRSLLVTVHLSDGREFRLPKIESRLTYRGSDIRAVIPCKSIVLAVGEDKVLILPVQSLGITSHGDIQLMDISCDSMMYAWSGSQ